MSRIKDPEVPKKTSYNPSKGVFIGGIGLVENLNSTFDTVISETIKQVQDTLLVKAKEYVRNNDVYHNFNTGAKRTGLIPEKVLDGFLLKHEISIADMTNDISGGKLPSVETVNEKFNDNIIYLLIKKAMITERIKNSEDESK